MDAPISIKVETDNKNLEDNLNYGQDCRGHFSEDSEVSHSSSNNLERESLNIHIKQQQPTASIKEELAIVNEIIHQIPQDESVLNDFLWPSYLKKEPVDTEVGSEVGTEDGSGEKSQFNEILKSKYPLVLLKDLKYTHGKILDQHQREEFRKRLRQKRPIRYCSFEDESLYPYKKLRSRLSQKSYSEDQTDDEDHETMSRGNNKSKDSYAWNIENNFREKNKSKNSCDQNKTSGITNCRLKSHSISNETGDNESLNFQHVKHKNTNLFKCDHCDFESDFKRDLVSHNLRCCSKKAKLNLSQNFDVVAQSKNSQKNTISLSEIILSIYNDREPLNGNASLPSSTEVLKCLECNFETTNPKYLEFHLQIHAEVLKCPECSYESTDTGTFKGHLMTHLDHFPSEGESDPYSFRIRSKQYNKTALGESSNEERHDSDFDDDIEEEDKSKNDEPCRRKIYKCHDCDFKTNYLCAIKSHNKRHNPELIKNRENDLSKCFSIANDNVNYHMLSLSEVINLFYNKEESLNLGTSDQTIIDVLKCVECTFETENLKLFNLHSQIHFEVKKCTECGFKSKDTEAFKDHLINHFKHKKSPKEAQKVRDLESNLKNTKFSCTDCSYETKYKESFDAHCAKHKNIKLFKCDDCDFESNYKKDLIRHKLKSCRKKGELNSSQNWAIVNHSKNSQFGFLSLSEIFLLIYNKMESFNGNASLPSSTVPLKCLECNFETTNPKYLEFHSQIHAEVLKCPECIYESTDAETFKGHLMTHLDQFPSERESVPYSFRIRSRQSNKTALDESLNDERHDPDYDDDIEEEDKSNNDEPRRRKKYKCHDCSYTTYKNKDFVSHCSDHAKEQQFKCEHCYFKTNYLCAIKSHNIRHNPEFIKKPENDLSNCFNIANDNNGNYHMVSLSEIINLFYNKDKSLDLSTSDEITIEVFKCVECTFETENLKLFNLHSQIHFEVKKCTECNFESKDTEAFKDHLINHFKHKKSPKEAQKVRDLKSNLKNTKFSCTDCSYETKIKELLDAHCAKHKNIKLFKCDDCDFESNCKKHLIRHKYKCCQKKGELNSNESCVVVNDSENAKFCTLSLSEIMLLIYNNWKSLDENNSVPSSVEPLKCLECNFETESQKYLKFHSQIHSKVQRCPECTHESTDTQIFKEHLLTHLDQFSSESKSVPYSFRKSSKPSSKTVRDLKSNLKNTKFICTDCSYETKYKESFDAHCAKHKNIKLFKCDDCDFGSNFKKHLRRHKINTCQKKGVLKSSQNCVTVNQSKNSIFCSLSLSEIMLLIYNNWKSLNENTSVPSSTEPLKCLECNFETENKKYLKFHSQIHAEVQKCPECSYESTDTETFREHLITHLDHSTSESESVPYIFRKRSKPSYKTVTDEFSDEEDAEMSDNHKNQDSDFEDEMSDSHSSLEASDFEEDSLDNDKSRKRKKFECHDCDYATCNNEAFISHCLNHAKEKLFQCEHCSFKTNYRKTMKYHHSKCLKNPENSLSKCLSIFNNLIRNYYSLSLCEIVGMICSKDNSLDHNTSEQIKIEVWECLDCTFKTGNLKFLNLHSQIHKEVTKCTECNFESKDTKIFKIHLIDHFRQKSRLNIRIFKCTYCSYETESKELFDAHCAKHKNIKLFKCDGCDFESNYKKDLIHHKYKSVRKKGELNSSQNWAIVNQSKNTQFGFLSLSEIFLLIYNKMESLNGNASLPSSTEPLKCLECKFETANPKCLEFHSQIHAEVLKCPECSYESTDTETFKGHLMTHLDQSPSESESVPYSFRITSKQSNKIDLDELSYNHERQNSDFKNELLDIEEENISNNDEPLRRRKYKCHDCSYATYKNKDFVVHCSDHAKEQQFKCEHCDFKTNYLCAIKSHNIRHNPEFIKKPESDLSNCFNIANDDNGNYHTLSLSEIINLFYNKDKSLDLSTFDEITIEVFKCVECTFETENLKLFNLHLQIHFEVKKCTECNFESKDTEAFKDHLINHFKHKNIEAHKVRDLKSDLNHTKFSCSDCSYQTKYKQDFNAHCAKHKNIKLFKCDDCDFESNYQKHLKTHKLNNCPKKGELNSSQNCVTINQSKNSKFCSLSLSEIMLLIYNNMKLLDENTSVPSSMVLLKCLKCRFETTNPKCLEFHSQIHAEVLKCPECSYESTDTETFKGHLMTHLDQSPSEGESVPYSFRIKSIQSNKTITVESSEIEHNETSDLHKSHESAFEDEMSDIKEDNISENGEPLKKKRVKCHDCIYATSKNETFISPRLNHVNEELFQCEHCDFKTDYIHTMKLHNLKCLMNLEKSLSKYFSITNDEIWNYSSFSLSSSEIINLICRKDKSLDLETSDKITVEVLKCLDCTFATENLKFMNLHSQIHDDIKKCNLYPQCNFESKNTHIFKSHLINHFIHNLHLSTKMFKCSDCSFETKYKDTFDAHWAKHKNIKLFKCDCCDFESNYKEGLIHHNNTKCSKKADLNSKQNCVIADQSKKAKFSSLSLSEIMLFIFNRKSLFENSSIPSSTELLKCLECNFETENQKCFEFHSQIHAEVLKCPQCSHESNDTESFKEHLITHLDESEFVPFSSKKGSRHLSKTDVYNSACDKHSEISDSHNSQNSDFENEMSHSVACSANVQKKKEYKCDLCEFETELHSNFVSHLLLHKENSDCGNIKAQLKNLKKYSLSEIISRIYNDENEVKQDTNLNSDKKLYKCSQCNFECDDKEQLLHHLSSHSSEKKFICSHCSYECSNENELDSHLSKCSNESSNVASSNMPSCESNSDKVFKCSRCNFETKKEKHFTLHSQIHAKLKKCTECEYEVYKGSKFKDHIKCHLRTKLYTCSECGYETNVISRFKCHLLNHTSVRIFNCSECDYKTNQKYSFKNHLQNHLAFKTYRCSECDYSTSFPHSLKVHILDHSEKKQFLCSVCNYGCNNKNRMQRHILQHSSEKLYKCTKCDFGTNHMKNLKEHEARLHGGQYLHTCNLCDFKCFKLSSLKKHSTVHSDTKLYKCPECSYECNSNLKLHIKNMHSKTKMYKCSECKYEGNHRSNFLTHIRTHSNERKYSCSECSFSCNRKDNLKVHMTTHLKNKLFKCADCSFECSNKYQLRRHVLKH